MLACVIWICHALIEMAVVWHFTWLAVIWAAHGLILMLIMNALLDRALALPGRVLRLGLAVLLPIAFAVLQSLIDLGFTLWMGDATFLEVSTPAGIDFNPNNYPIQTAFKLTFKVYIWLFGFYAVAVSLLRATRVGYEARLDAQEARLQALRLQVAPHFLFNALNSLSTLVTTGRNDDAEAMIGRLSDFYRSSLLASDEDLAPLEQELDAIADYLEIEHVRFGDRLRVSFDVAEDLADARVPRLILQPLVENAMKHGVARTSAPIHIRVSAHSDDGRLSLGVVNDLPRGDPDGPPPGTGSGLANIRRRLFTLYGPGAQLTTSDSDAEWRAVVTLPAALAN